jgi:hypothetical protein
VNPWRHISILEKKAPSFRQLFYPESLRYQGDWRTVQAIEEHLGIYFPRRKQCRGHNWSLVIKEDEPLYAPSRKARRKLEKWKATIHGTVAEFVRIF